MRRIRNYSGIPRDVRGCKKNVDTPQRDKDTMTDQRAHKHITRFPQNFSEYEPQIVRFKVKKNVERFYSFAYIS